MATPRKISVNTEIENGKFVVNRDLILDAIRLFEGKKITVIIERFFNKRSNKQNAYYWGVVVEHWKNILLDEWGEIFTEKEVHVFLKSNLNYEEVVDQTTGEVTINPVTHEVLRKPKSTTKNTTFDQEKYHEACRQLAFSMFQYLIPLPEKKEDRSVDVKF